jgi:hypothetical protein
MSEIVHGSCETPAEAVGRRWLSLHSNNISAQAEGEAVQPVFITVIRSGISWTSPEPVDTCSRL